MTALFNGDDSDADESDDHFTAISSHRYLSRSSVLKTAQWSPSPRLIVLMDPMRAPRNLRMSRNTFVFLLRRIEADPAFARKFFFYSTADVDPSDRPALRYRGRLCGDRTVCAVLALEGEFLRWPNKGERVGQPGSLHDKRAMSLTVMSDNPGNFFDPGQYVIARSHATRLSTGSSHNSELLLSILKARFSILDAIRERVQNDSDVESVSKRIVSWFIIHNVCIDCDDTFDVSIAPTTDDDLQADEDVEVVEVVDWSTEDSEDLRTRMQEVVLRRRGF
ncbi:hypothetical protein GN244_ATG00165 [Phytophthora infestans]|uniref:Uncharacterized protein n=1 Tax=Phytophthora infestans TaxID=4787 RepID=A0A833W932_PHYIN|nr:hypothetical protein GN244_ATG00165 [Phytophthora infestans]